MNHREQEEFIRKNRHLSVEQLSSQTSLPQRQIRRILERTAGNQRLTPAPGPGELGKISPGSPSKLIWTAAFLPAFLTFLVYLPSLNDAFVNLDDHEYIIDNIQIRSINGAFFHWCFTTFYQGNWIPLAWINLALDYAWGKLNPLVYHLHSLILHSLNTLLVFFLSFQLLTLAGKPEAGGKTLPPHWALSGAFLTAILFGLHPLHVESTAWANEERDVLCGFFYLLSLLIYTVSFNPSRKPWSWAASLGCFALALMAKPMAVSLPLVLILLDYWPLKRLRQGTLLKVTAEKVPFLVLALAGIVIAPLAQAGSQYMGMNNILPLDYKIMNAFHSLIFYLLKMIWPFGLHPFYPLDLTYAVDTPVLLGSAALVILISWFCFQWRDRRPWMGAAWLYYVITLGPVLGLMQTGSQAAADRFTYLPSLGPFLLFSAGLSWLLFKNRAAVLAAGLALAAGLGFLTSRQLAIWRGDIPFFEDITRFCPDLSATFHTFLDQAYRNAGRLNDALVESEKAVSLAPNDYLAHFNNGSILLNLGRLDEAMGEFRTALKLNPHYAYSHLNLAIAYDKKGMKKENLEELQKAVQADPQCVIAYRDLGVFYQNQKEFAKAAEAFQSASTIDPASVEYIFDLAGAYEFGGRLDDAIASDERGIQLAPGNPLFYANMGMTYLLKGDRVKGVEALDQAEKLAPPNRLFYQQLGQAFTKAGEKAKAAECFQKVQALTSGTKP